jgi:hypothetical protein
MSAKSGKYVQKTLEKDFSKEVTLEILGMIDRLRKEGWSNSKIEEEVTQHLLHHIERDVKTAIAEQLGSVKSSHPNIVTVRPASRAKGYK